MAFSEDQISLFLEPLAPQAPCGIYLKLDKSAYRSIRNEFNLAQTSLRKLCQNPSEDEKDELESFNISSWDRFASTLLTLFTSTTRDIELISWFIASQILLDDSFESVANVFQWLADLIERHWFSINPTLSDDALTSDTDMGRLAEQTKIKLKAFSQLMGDSEESSLIYAPLLQTPLVGLVTFFDFQSADKKGEIPALKEKVALVLKDEKKEVQEKLNNTFRCLYEIDRIDAVLKIKIIEAQVKNVNLSFVKNLFTKVDAALQQLSGMSAQKKVFVSEHDENVPDQGDALDTSLTQEVDALSQQDLQGNIGNEIAMILRADNLNLIATSNNMNRDLAFRLLREVADYFYVSEPHSPISFMLEKAIRWGYLSLPELLQEMLKEKNSDQVEGIFSDLGLDCDNKLDLPHVK